VLLEIVSTGHPLQGAVAGRDQVNLVAPERIVFLIGEAFVRVDCWFVDWTKRLSRSSGAWWKIWRHNVGTTSDSSGEIRDATNAAKLLKNRIFIFR
jgi:hypothetical protein